MTTKQQLEIINKKLDLSLNAIAVMPIFIAAANAKDPKRIWKYGIREWEKIDKEYQEIMKNENNNNSTNFKNKVS